jgi:N-acetylglucosaminyldiphosphoundecaprenol N-acetyl-beta-D-mannosaminyltransferase
MTTHLPSVTVRMAIRGNVVERRSAEEVVEIVAARLRSRADRGLAIGSVNLDHLNHFQQLGTADGDVEWLLVADGMPIAWRGRALTAQPWPRVTGADLLPKVLELAEATGHRVGFLGGSVETHQRLAAHVAHRYPRLMVCGMWAPAASVVEQHAADLAADIRAAQIQILVVCLGKPRQELWVDRYGTATGARVFLPCGGAIDFMAGTTRRAPEWMQRAGLEWFHRLAHEPRRLARRYLVEGPMALARATRAELVKPTTAVATVLTGGAAATTATPQQGSVLTAAVARPPL